MPNCSHYRVFKPSLVDNYYSVMFGIKGIEALKVGSGALGVGPPIDGGSSCFAPCDQGLNFPPESHFVGESLCEAGTGHYAELNLGHPFGKLRTGLGQLPCLGGVVELQASGYLQFADSGRRWCSCWLPE